jgi:MFS family permease
MIFLDWFFGLIAPILFVVAFPVAYRMYKGNATKRSSGAALVVLSGMLAAIAIPIPVAAGFLPARNSGPRAWFLIGALVAAIAALCFIVYSMISLQKDDSFVVKDKRYVPGSINAAWLSLILLAVSGTAMKVHPAAAAEGTGSGHTFVAHELLNVGISRDEIIEAWGAPAWESESQLGYRTQMGTTLFCLDDKGVASKLLQTKEIDQNAVRKNCK